MTEETENRYNQIEEERGEEPKISTPFDPKLVDISVEQATVEQLAERIKYEEIDLMPLYIDENGNVDEWPKGFMDEWESQLDKLLD